MVHEKSKEPVILWTVKFWQEKVEKSHQHLTDLAGLFNRYIQALEANMREEGRRESEEPKAKDDVKTKATMMQQEYITPDKF